MNQPVVRATKNQIEEFKDSLLWKDIKRELGMWRKLCTQEYGQVVGAAINPGEGTERNSATTLIHLGDIHGREMAVDFMLAIPDVFLQILEDKADDTECE